MDAIYDKFHANKSERLRSFEDTVKNIRKIINLR